MVVVCAKHMWKAWFFAIEGSVTQTDSLGAHYP